MNSTLFPIAGAGCGMAAFIYSVCKLENVVYRVDSNNKKRISVKNFCNYLTAPFAFGTERFRTVWHLNMLNLNWVFMVASGSFFGFILKKF